MFTVGLLFKPSTIISSNILYIGNHLYDHNYHHDFVNDTGIMIGNHFAIAIGNHFGIGIGIEIWIGYAFV